MTITKTKVQCEKCNGYGYTLTVSPYSLRTIRHNANISLRSLAKKLGVSAPYLSDIERGRRNCTTAIETAYRKLLNQ